MDTKKVKIKDVSSSENLDQVLEGEGIDLPTMVPPQQEKYPLLIEKNDTINMGTKETPKNVLIANSLTNEEKHNFIRFLKETQINFAWTYADMLGLDPNLVVHNFAVRLDVKLVK